MHDAASLERVRSALSHLNYSDRDVWVRAALCIKSEFDDATGFDVWDAWGSQHENYKASAAKSVWNSVSAGGKTTIASLFYDAKAQGWADDTKFKKPSADELADRKAKAAARAEQAEREDAIKHAAGAARAQSIWDGASDCADHPYLERKGVKSHGLRIGTWEVVDADTGEVRVMSKNALLVPIRDAGKRIHSMQAIYPNKIGSRDKDYLRGGAKSGMFYSIGKPVTMDVRGTQRAVILIGEGYATMATAHEMTGHAVIVAFDAGNLPTVGKVLRARFPEAALVFLADNDRWTDGNPGLKHAKAAAEAVGGFVALPQFPNDETGQPKDFNDLFFVSGPDAVRDTIAEAINPPETIPDDEGPEPLPWEDDPDDQGGDEPPAARDGDEEGGVANNRQFRILGYNRGTYYLFLYGQRQIKECTNANFGEGGLIELASLNWWEINYPGERTKIDAKMAANAIIRTAESRGIYDPDKQRGRGAWVDEGRVVYHHGGFLTVGGANTDVTDIKSRYIYELDRSLEAPAATPITDAEGQQILDLSKCFRWSKPCSAALLAGWVALAPMGGALRWRPHIWLTGGAGCGKSTVLDRFVHYLCAGQDEYAQGNSSEAGIRQKLSHDAKPVLFDESESNEESDARRMQNVLSLIRQSSTESDAQTLKGTAGGTAQHFHIRSMFCLASIQVALKQQADIERLTVLVLRPKRDDTDAAGNWVRLNDMLFTIQSDPTLPARLFRRSLDLLPTTLKNIVVFSNAAAQKFNSQRDGDQYGTLLAGAWSLISTELATKEQAMELINSYDWSEHRENNDSDEGERALSSLFGAFIRVKGGIELTVRELVCAAYGEPCQTVDITMEMADALLQRYGMKVRDDRLMLANGNDALKRLMAGTTFEADYRGVLLRVRGADRNDNKPSRFNGVTTKCFTLPLGPIVSTDRSEAAF